MTCTDPVPTGEYGWDVYGGGVLSCTDESESVGYGVGLPACAPGWFGDPCLVATIISSTESLFIGHLSRRFGNETIRSGTYSECKMQLERSVGHSLIETRVSSEGVPDVVYLRLRRPCY